MFPQTGEGKMSGCNRQSSRKKAPSIQNKRPDWGVESQIGRRTISPRKECQKVQAQNVWEMGGKILLSSTPVSLLLQRIPTVVRRPGDAGDGRHYYLDRSN
uniref:Mitochondrial coenzyme A transporter SLC25A42 n=1 Tax=Schistocephalus solidus TaxID=70667 RepID=A0A0X3PN32_SCHSO